MKELDKYRFYSSILQYDISRLDWLLKDRTVRTFERDDIICMAGDLDPKLTVIVSGYAATVMYSPSGEELLLHVRGKGNIFGYESVKTKEPFKTSLVALSRCQAVIINAEEAWSIINADIKHLNDILDYERKRSTNYSHRSQLLQIDNRRTRLYVFLRALAAEVGVIVDKNYILLPFKLTHEMISRYININRITVTRIFSELAKEDIISTRGSIITITDIEKLISYIPEDYPPTLNFIR